MKKRKIWEVLGVAVSLLVTIVILLSVYDRGAHEGNYIASQESGYEEAGTELQESRHGETTMTPEEALDIFVQLARYMNFHNHRLRIYFSTPIDFQHFRPDVSDLTEERYEYRVIVSSRGMRQLWIWDDDLRYRIDTVTLVPVRNESRIRARVYYVFETNRGDKVFDVAMWGRNNSVFINGVEFEWDDVFYDIIRPHLPLRAVEVMDRHFSR